MQLIVAGNIWAIEGLQDMGGNSVIRDMASDAISRECVVVTLAATSGIKGGSKQRTRIRKKRRKSETKNKQNTLALAVNNASVPWLSHMWEPQECTDNPSFGQAFQVCERAIEQKACIWAPKPQVQIGCPCQPPNWAKLEFRRHTCNWPININQN